MFPVFKDGVVVIIRKKVFNGKTLKKAALFVKRNGKSAVTRSNKYIRIFVFEFIVNEFYKLPAVTAVLKFGNDCKDF